MRSPLTLFAAYLLSGSACAEVEPIPELVPAETTAFESTLSTQAYEVLLRDCAFVECHGASGRFLRVVGPGRVRLSQESSVFAPATPDELALTYDRVLAQIDAQDPLSSDLLRKPLAEAAGGAGHRGLDVYGRDVYASPQDASYQILQQFVMARAQNMQDMQDMAAGAQALQPGANIGAGQ